jgi:hypothetical protein
MSACAGPRPSVDLTADAPQVETPAYAREKCAITGGDPATLSDLENRDRARGVDVQDCDGKRALAVQTNDLNAANLKAWRVARERRTSWSCRWLRLGC